MTIDDPTDARALAGPDDALYDVDGDTVTPTRFSQGPWSKDAQHGSAVAAILAHGVEGAATPVPMRPARFTVDLLRPVPLEPMTRTVDVVRAGRRIAVVDVSLRHGDTLVARASTLLMRDGASYHLPEPPTPNDPPMPPTEPVQSPFGAAVVDYELPGFARAMIYERTRGTHHSGAPASAWIGLRTTVVRGEPVTPFQLLAVASDMGSALGSHLDFGQWRAINADITLHVLRLPVGDRVGLDGAFWVDPGGIGMSGCELFDHDGYLARMTSSAFVDRWGD